LSAGGSVQQDTRRLGLIGSLVNQSQGRALIRRGWR